MNKRRKGVIEEIAVAGIAILVLLSLALFVGFIDAVNWAAHQAQDWLISEAAGGLQSVGLLGSTQHLATWLQGTVWPWIIGIVRQAFLTLAGH